MPAQQGWFWLHGNLIDPEGRIALTVANGITADDAHTILNALNRDPALQKLVKAAQFALTTPGLIKGRDELQKAVDEVLRQLAARG